MAQWEDEIEAEGARIIWVLEEDTSYRAGTAESCRSFMDSKESARGLCVGDAETLPTAGAFDDSALANARGFDMIVTRRDMVIRDAFTHGTGRLDENPGGEEVLMRVRAVLGR